MPTQNEIRERITNTIIEALEKGGLAPWRQPWSMDKNAGLPENVVSKRRYRGINPLLLQIARVPCNAGENLSVMRPGVPRYFRLF